MLIKLQIEPHEEKRILNKSVLAGSIEYDPFFKACEEKSTRNNSRTFPITELKIKYMNEGYYVYSKNGWLPIKANELLIFDEYKIKVSLVPETIPLPFEPSHSLLPGNDARQPLSDYGSASSEKDPLAFLYNTPAQKIAALEPSTKAYFNQKESDFAITFLGLIQNREGAVPRNFLEHSLLLGHNSPAIEEDPQKKGLTNGQY